MAVFSQSLVFKLFDDMKSGVGLLVVIILLELCMTYGSSCHYHFHHPLLQ